MISKPENINLPIEQNKKIELLVRFSDFMKTFIEFDNSREEPYGLIESIYKNAEEIRNLEKEMDFENKSDRLEIGIGNIKMIMKSFFENKPELVIRKEEILKAKDLSDLNKLQNKIREELEIRTKMTEMENEWGTFTNELTQNNISGSIPLPERSPQIEK